jgi:tetratricopeptide (TPR) repeat protein
MFWQQSICKMVFLTVLVALPSCSDLGTINKERGDSERANSQINIDNNKLLQDDPLNSILNYERGLNLLEENTTADTRLAKVGFQIAVRSDPNIPKYHRALAAAHYRLGEYDESLDAYIRSQKLIADTDRDYLTIALIAYRAGYFPIAKTAYGLAEKKSDAKNKYTTFLNETFSSGQININNLAGASDRVAPVQESEESTTSTKDTLIAEVLIILEESYEYSAEGIDTLGQLRLLVSGDVFDYSTSIDLENDSRDTELNRNLKFSLGDTISYGLDLFRSSSSKFKLETSPSLNLQEGQTSEFSAMKNFYALTYDEDSGNLDDVSDFFEVGLSLSLTANEIEEQGAKIDIEVSEGAITNVSTNANSNALNANLITTENIKFSSSLDIPFDRVVPVAIFNTRTIDNRGAGTKAFRDMPFLGKLVGSKNENTALENGMVLISLRKLETISRKELVRKIYKNFENISNSTVEKFPSRIKFLPNDIPKFFIPIR